MMKRTDQFQTFGKFAASIAGMALARAFEGIDGRDGAKMAFNREKGLPLAELELAGEKLHQVTLLGPDEIRIETGEQPAIKVEGEDAAKDALRFGLSDGKLTIMRESTDWQDRMTTGKAVVRIVMPPPSRLSIAGSGSITSEALDPEKAKLIIAGSGRLTCHAISTGKLIVRILGSGSLYASGVTQHLKLAVAGSGTARMEGLSTPGAKVKIAGSGSAVFASDGTVEADIVGSGAVTVKGRASCTVKGLGSGRLVCQPA